MAYDKPLPVLDNVNKPYWEAAKRQEFILQKCQDCGKVMFPPSSLCNNCLSNNLEWTKLSGKGKVWSHVRMHQMYWKGFGPDIPYNVIWVQLDEGPMMISNMVGIDDKDIKVDIPVEVVFDDITEEWTLPKFKPAG